MTVVDLQSTTVNMGYGTQLMIKACKEAVKVGIYKVFLDDCSSRYRKPNNIYTKLGMVYTQEEGPEMIGDTRIISRIDSNHKLPIIHTLIV